MSSVPFKFYYDLLCPPSRALITFFRVANIPAEAIPVALRKGEQRTDQYKKNVNRFAQVPCINDQGFKLSESVAILRYVKKTRVFDDFWYPEDVKAQAAVEEYLSWMHNNLHWSAGLYFVTKWRTPMLTGKEADEKVVKRLEADLSRNLDIIENDWLGNKPFIAGESITVADIFAACDMEQTRTCGFNPLASRPNLSAWYARIKEKLDPAFTDHHKFVYKYEERAKEAVRQ